MSEGVIRECADEEARRLVGEVRHEFRNYKAVAEIKAETLKGEVDQRAKDVTKSLDEIKSLMKWAGSLIITLIIGVLGWSLVQQYQSNEQQKKDLESQIRLLQEQERTRTIAQQNSARLDTLAPSGSEAPVAPAGSR